MHVILLICDALLRKILPKMDAIALERSAAKYQVKSIINAI